MPYRLGALAEAVTKYGLPCSVDGDPDREVGGVATLEGLNAGRFRALIWTPLMGWLGIPPLEQDVGISFGDSARVEVSLPKAAEVT